MKEFLLLIGVVLVSVGLIIFQLKLLKKNHPKAELLISLFKALNASENTPGND